MSVTRRSMLAGSSALLTLPLPACADLPTAPRPSRRPAGLDRARAEPLAAILARSGLGDHSSLVVLDASSGEVLESHNPGMALPPASTAKAVTTLYALDRLGAGERFATQLLAEGRLSDGTLSGDLTLLGSGDPTLDTDRLARLLEIAADAGLRRVSGRFRLATGRFPSLTEIAGDQPPQVGYNPGVSGLNLNWNRVFFQWRPTGGGYSTVVEARAARLSPRVSGIRVDPVNRRAPLYDWALEGGEERWTVASPFLGRGGNRYLPVRRTVRLAGEVLHAIAADRGIALPRPETGGAPAQPWVLATDVSDPLSEICRGMLRYSNNMTAEAVGLRASLGRGLVPGTLSDSAAAMTHWIRAQAGLRQARFVDHSGLGADSRLTGAEMARLMALSSDGPLRGVMRDMTPENTEGEVRAKTGTLNFVTCLAGYIDGRARRLAFAILSGEPTRRAALPLSQRESPPGGAGWTARARAQRDALLRRWAIAFA